MFLVFLFLFLKPFSWVCIKYFWNSVHPTISISSICPSICCSFCLSLVSLYPSSTYHRHHHCCYHHYHHHQWLFYLSCFHDWLSCYHIQKSNLFTKDTYRFPLVWEKRHFISDPKWNQHKFIGILCNPSISL